MSVDDFLCRMKTFRIRAEKPEKNHLQSESSNLWVFGSRFLLQNRIVRASTLAKTLSERNQVSRAYRFVSWTPFRAGLRRDARKPFALHNFCLKRSENAALLGLSSFWQINNPNIKLLSSKKNIHMFVCKHFLAQRNRSKHGKSSRFKMNFRESLFRYILLDWNIFRMSDGLTRWKRIFRSGKKQSIFQSLAMWIYSSTHVKRHQLFK